MIRVNGISKRFRLYRHPADRLKELLLRRVYSHDHQALQNVSFAVPSGQTLGIIGPNGAGKSTLLKLLTGVLLPDSGTIEQAGRITGLLELGTGFNAELSGLDNIHNNGLLVGMTPEEIASQHDAIIAFSELGDFIREPLKTYSSGMVMRLAFAIAIHAQPDTFLIDEALAVGDAHFQQKCVNRIRQFREAGGSVILVSHDLNAIKMLCDRALLLHRGEVFEYGDPEAVVNAYNYLIALQSEPEVSRSASIPGRPEYGTGAAAIDSVAIVGSVSGGYVVSSGEVTHFRIAYHIERPLPDITVGIMIRDRFGQDIFGTNTHLLEYPLPTEPGPWQIEFTMALDIAPGRYTLTVALHTRETHIDNCYHWRDHAAQLEVAGLTGPAFAGVCRLHPQLRGQRLEAAASLESSPLSPTEPRHDR